RLAEEIEAEVHPDAAPGPFGRGDRTAAPAARPEAEAAETLADADPALDQHHVDQVLLAGNAQLAPVEESLVDRVDGEGEAVLVDLGEDAVVALSGRHRGDRFGRKRVLEVGSEGDRAAARAQRG